MAWGSSGAPSRSPVPTAAPPVPPRPVLPLQPPRAAPGGRHTLPVTRPLFLKY